jgi:hypothetical protein
MKNAAECLAKAEELAARARDCPDGVARDGYLAAADGWRRTALLARQQEVWAEAHPDA